MERGKEEAREKGGEEKRGRKLGGRIGKNDWEGDYLVLVVKSVSKLTSVRSLVSSNSTGAVCSICLFLRAGLRTLRRLRLPSPTLAPVMDPPGPPSSLLKSSPMRSR